MTTPSGCHQKHACVTRPSPKNVVTLRTLRRSTSNRTTCGRLAANHWIHTACFAKAFGVPVPYPPSRANTHSGPDPQISTGFALLCEPPLDSARHLLWAERPHFTPLRASWQVPRGILNLVAFLTAPRLGGLRSKQSMQSLNVHVLNLPGAFLVLQRSLQITGSTLHTLLIFQHSFQAIGTSPSTAAGISVLYQSITVDCVQTPRKLPRR